MTPRAETDGDCVCATESQDSVLNVLLIEDDLQDAQMVEVLLNRLDDTMYKIDWVGTIAEGVGQCSDFNYDIALVDLNLPDARGSQAVHQLSKARDQLPIIVLSGNEDEELAVSLIESGAQDYLMKGDFGTANLNRAIRYAIERKATEIQLRERATSDVLTGLVNRDEMTAALGKAIALSDSNGSMTAFVLIDLDNFKQVNDRHGHAVGDEMLRIVADRLTQSLQIGDVAARLGGDEFAVILENIESEDDLILWLNRLREAINVDMTIDNVVLRLSSSIGASLYPRDGADMDRIVRSADLAMYSVKNTGKNQHALYRESMEHTLRKRQLIESEIRNGLEAGEFAPHFQPQVSLTSGQIVGLEALCRWNRTDKVYALPSEYIALIQDFKLISELGRVILMRVCRDMHSWRNMEALANLPVSVKVDLQELRDPGYAKGVLDILKRSGVDVSRVQLELVHTALTEPDTTIRQNMASLSAAGIHYCVDHLDMSPHANLGTDQSNVKVLKLSRERTAAIWNKKTAVAVTRALTNLADELGLTVIGEGVETARQFRALQQLGCHNAQGYFIARPMKPAALIRWIETQYGPQRESANGLTGRFRLPPPAPEFEKVARSKVPAAQRQTEPDKPPLRSRDQ